jgi:hypothetical protein
LATLAAVGPALGYIHGGDFIGNNSKEYPDKLRSAGWAVGCEPVAGGGPTGRRSGPPPRRREEGAAPTYTEKQANELVVRALQSLSLKDLEKISDEDKRELARIALEAMQRGGVEQGKTGPIKYQVGCYSYENLWETRNGPPDRAEKEITKVRAGVVPFVAVKVVKD